MMQNLKRNWLVSWKLTSGFDECWPEHSKISKICTLMSFFLTKYKMFELKRYRGVLLDGTKYWCNIWRKTDLCFQKWHEEFSQFSPVHVWKSKNWEFDGILLSEVKNLWAQNLQGVLCHDNEEWYKIWREIDLSVQNWHEEFD